jgi:large subunit ribosomal protein L20
MRVKSSHTKKTSHKNILRLAKGYRMTRHRLYKVAKEAVLHAGEYAFVGRKRRKRDFRRLWIVQIKAALGLQEKPLTYSRFINLAKTKNVKLDRKSLSTLAGKHPEIFSKIINFINS